jgi:hypothetical protein
MDAAFRDQDSPKNERARIGNAVVATSPARKT